MLVSFIIPHKGREELLIRTIHSITELEYDLDEIEVIVVTQNKALENLRSDQVKVHLRIVFRSEHETISALRNAGVELALGEYLAFLDADIQLSRNWLKAMFYELEAKPGRLLVSAGQECEHNATQLEKIRVMLNTAVTDNPREFLDGRNLFMKRQTFETAGGFPEHLVTCEDFYFTNKVHQIGEVYSTSKAAYIHLGEDKQYGEMFRKEIWRGQSNLRSIQGRKISLREIPSLLTPFWQACFLLITMLSLFWGKAAITIFSLVMFCLPIFLYAIRLYKIGKKRISFGASVWFYCVYLLARVIGTTIGLFKTIRL